MSHGEIVFSAAKTLIAIEDITLDWQAMKSARDGFRTATVNAMAAWNCNTGYSYMEGANGFIEYMDGVNNNVCYHINKLTTVRTNYVSAETLNIELEGQVSGQYSSSGTVSPSGWSGGYYD